MRAQNVSPRRPDTERQRSPLPPALNRRRMASTIRGAGTSFSVPGSRSRGRAAPARDTEEKLQ